MQPFDYKHITSIGHFLYNQNMTKKRFIHSYGNSIFLSSWQKSTRIFIPEVAKTSVTARTKQHRQWQQQQYHLNWMDFPFDRCLGVCVCVSVWLWPIRTFKTCNRIKYVHLSLSRGRRTMFIMTWSRLVFSLSEYLALALCIILASKVDNYYK